MYWLLKSLQSDVPCSPTSSPDHSRTNHNGGVKDDLSVIGETIGRQLRGVAAFLAPPPSPPSVTAAEQRAEHEEEELWSSDKLVGIRNDLAEIGGSFKGGLSLLSSNKAVSEISKFASSFLQFPDQDDRGGHDKDEDDDHDDDDDDGVPGITDELPPFLQYLTFPTGLVTYAISKCAWGSDNLCIVCIITKGLHQYCLVGLALLMADILMRISDLCTVVETRDALLQKLQNNKNAQTENSSLDASEESGKFGGTVQENVSSEERVCEIVNAAEGLEITSGEDSAAQWVEEADISSGSSVRVEHNLEHEEDVSFSDLEDDDNYHSNRVSLPKSKQHDKAPSSGSNDWVQLKKRPETRGDLQKAGLSNFDINTLKARSQMTG
ncbi:ENTH/ANTH/VHS superfamily protein isoform 1 [Hibiscus syriacus]|uniref:ENTH/ANTH/VHS superfamily protein isoform 1 n=1 Tax=Hibiscus syriacus TaxID=106335 RepID=A0A6A2WG89_HIBSY|nr:ENTH/ANTH/VHS superfamily protein isoform 1 [Hibiscus syriacus]